jgi:hypothetical protein
MHRAFTDARYQTDGATDRFSRARL